MKPAPNHPTLEDLLDHRDGRGTTATTKHLASCEACRERLEETYQLRSQLRALSSLAPPRDRWPAVRAAIEAESSRRRRSLIARAGLAAAAIALFALVAVFIVDRSSELAARQALEAQLNSLREQSERLDDELRALQRRAMPTWRAELLLPLEDDLFAIDGEIDSQVLSASGEGTSPNRLTPDELIELWQDRLTLQDTMLQVHYAPAVVETSFTTDRGSL